MLTLCKRDGHTTEWWPTMKTMLAWLLVAGCLAASVALLAEVAPSPRRGAGLPQVTPPRPPSGASRVLAGGNINAAPLLERHF
jgi:hypothetical protein